MRATKISAAVGLVAAAIGFGPAVGADSPDEQAAARFKAAGKAAPLTVFPVLLAGKPSAQVGEVVAMLLEQAGMTNLETSDVVFTPPDGTDAAAASRAFAEFVRTNPPTTEYALWADFRGTPGKGVNEVRAVVVSSKGEIVWQERQAPGDAVFDRVKPREPLQCCVLVVQRLRPFLKLGDPTAGGAPAGKIARRWQKATGLPDEAERAAMAKRAEAFKNSAAKSTLLVYPARTGEAHSAESAVAIAASVNGKRLAKALAAEQGPRLPLVRDMNEQKVLWSMARGLSEYVKKNPPAADYVLLSDYMLGKDAARGVHFALCDRDGGLVVVDFQNSHSPDFKALKPKSRSDCDALVVKRIQAHLR
jgi:hypothetical protein